MSTTARDIATKAAKLVGADRARQYGDAREMHDAIASVWNGILIAAGKGTARPLDAHDVANLMEGLKIARRYHGAANLDNYVDGAGYAAIAGAVR